MLLCFIYQQLSSLASSNTCWLKNKKLISVFGKVAFEISIWQLSRFVLDWSVGGAEGNSLSFIFI